MFCQAVWAEGRLVDLLEWAQGISDAEIVRVESWHSEWGEANHPWTEWRIIDVQGDCRVRWRVRESLDWTAPGNEETPEGTMMQGGETSAG